MFISSRETRGCVCIVDFGLMDLYLLSVIRFVLLQSSIFKFLFQGDNF